MELFEELRVRLGTLGMREWSGEIDDFGLDLDALETARPAFDFLLDRWWRAGLLHASRVPEAGPALVVANRSGLLPWDGLMLAHALERLCPAAGRPRFLVADWLMALPFVHPAVVRYGGVRACPENTSRLLRAGARVIAFPEGQRGAAKVFRERYRLRRFGRGGVVRVALRAGVPLLPVGVVGAEEVHPVLFKITGPARSLGLPFLPVTPTFPWLGPFGALPLPSRWVIAFGEPLDLDGLSAEDAEDDLLVSRLTLELRRRIARLVDEGLKARSGVFA